MSKKSYRKEDAVSDQKSSQLLLSRQTNTDSKKKNNKQKHKSKQKQITYEMGNKFRNEKLDNEDTENPNGTIFTFYSLQIYYDFFSQV